jgi:hypothetical protein
MADPTTRRRWGMYPDPPVPVEIALACEHPALESKYAVDGPY